MSKGNMLFSQARGKVGDLVFSRLNGEQIVRSRNRHPKNPKTNAQLFQRAIMATVLRAYSAGKVIFDHAFEGKQVGAQCQRAFLSLNAKALRAAIAADIEVGSIGANCTARVVGPGVDSPVGNNFIVSKGSLTQDVFSSSASLKDIGEYEGTISQFLTQKGITRDDLFTLVAFYSENPGDMINVLFTVNGVDSPYGKQIKGSFGFWRMRVKESALTSQEPLTFESLLSDVFELTETNTDILFFDRATVSAGLFDKSVTGSGTLCGFSGVIRSRENEGLRSDCILLEGGGSPMNFGITSDLALRAWKQGATPVADSDLILEGGDL